MRLRFAAMHLGMHFVLVSKSCKILLCTDKTLLLRLFSWECESRTRRSTSIGKQKLCEVAQIVIVIYECWYIHIYICSIYVKRFFRRKIIIQKRSSLWNCKLLSLYYLCICIYIQYIYIVYMHIHLKDLYISKIEEKFCDYDIVEGLRLISCQKKTVALILCVYTYYVTLYLF